MRWWTTRSNSWNLPEDFTRRVTWMNLVREGAWRMMWRQWWLLVSIVLLFCVLVWVWVLLSTWTLSISTLSWLFAHLISTPSYFTPSYFHNILFPHHLISAPSYFQHRVPRRSLARENTRSFSETLPQEADSTKHHRKNTHHCWRERFDQSTTETQRWVCWCVHCVVKFCWDNCVINFCVLLVVMRCAVTFHCEQGM